MTGPEICWPPLALATSFIVAGGRLSGTTILGFGIWLLYDLGCVSYSQFNDLDGPLSLILEVVNLYRSVKVRQQNER
jgi:hypothetical protein